MAFASQITIPVKNESTGVIQNETFDLKDDNLTSQVSSLDSELSMLTTRVDQIIAPSGEAPNPAEITDARIGADGDTYNTLGNAIRTQVSDVKSAINENLQYLGFVDFGASDGSGDSKGIKISQASQVIKALGTSTGNDVIKLTNGFTHGSGNTQGASEHLSLIEGHQYFLVICVKEGSTFSGVSWGPDIRIIKSDGNNLVSKKVPVTGDKIVFSSVFTATDSNVASINFVIPGGATINMEFVYGIIDVAAYSIWNNKVNAGVLSDITELFAKSDTIEAKMDEIVTTNENLLDGVTYESGKYWGHGSLTQALSETAVSYAKIPIVAGKTYYYRKLYAYFCNIQYADNSITAFSNNTGNSQNGSFTAAQNGYVYITVHTNSLSTCIFTDSKMSYTNNILQRFYTPNKLLIDGITNCYTVKKDGTGDFTKITDAVKEAVKYENSTIFIDAGEYDLVEEFGNELSTAGASMGGIFLKNNIHLIGTPNTVIKFNYTGDNGNVKQYWSVFNANTDGFTLENINIEASNIRYCVHDELNGYNNPYQNRYKNCKMYLDNSENDVFPSTQCIGGGFGGNGTIIIEDCHFKTETTEWGSISLSWHNNSGSTGKSKLFMKGCFFEGDNNRCRFTWNGTSEEITDIYVSNNSFGKSVIVQGENASATENNISVHQWNNEIRNP